MDTLKSAIFWIWYVSTTIAGALGLVSVLIVDQPDRILIGTDLSFTPEMRTAIYAFMLVDGIWTMRWRWSRS